MKTKQLEALYEKLELKSRRGRGGTYPYVPWQDVADRMNKVFGGNWSSEVKSETVVGNGIILRVRVTVIDEETNVTYYQEGYGGADNSGSEVGTLHKSAYSKALRDACKKWGPGLYTDEYDYTSQPSVKTSPPASSAPSSPPASSAPSSPPAVAPPVSNSKAIPAATPSTPAVPVNSSPPNQSIPAAPAAKVPSVPVVNTPAVSIPKNVTAPPPPASIPTASQNTVAPPVGATTTSLPPTSTSVVSPMSTQSFEDAKINDVQMAALDGILEIKDIDPAVLIKEAFEEGDMDINNIPAKEALSYQQAVLVIKYGNEKFRK